MSIIKHPLLYVGSKGEKYLYTLFDSGANLSCINPECYWRRYPPEMADQAQL